MVGQMAERWADHSADYWAAMTAAHSADWMVEPWAASWAVDLVER